MKLGMMVFVAVVAANFSIWADQAERKVLAEKLYEVMGAEEQTAVSREQRLSMADDIARLMDPDSSGGFDEAGTELNVYQKRVKSALSSENGRDDLVSIYVDVYSDVELQELVTFYSSPVGRASVEKSSEINRRIQEMKLERLRTIYAERGAVAGAAAMPASSDVAGADDNLNPTVYAFIVPVHVWLNELAEIGSYTFEWKNKGRGYSSFVLLADRLIADEAGLRSAIDTKAAAHKALAERTGAALEEVGRKECRYGNFVGTEIHFAAEIKGHRWTYYLLYLWDGSSAWEGWTVLEDSVDYNQVQGWLMTAQRQALK